MSADAVCRCCLLRPPDKDLKSEYSRLGKIEIFADMLKECFEIHLPYDDDEYGSGICDTCVARLRDACDFKLQVQACALEMLVPSERREEQLIKDEKPPVVKEEIPDPDEDNGLLFLHLKEEMSSFDEDEEDSKSLAQMLAFSGVVKKKKRSAKKLIEKSERKAKKLLQGGLKLYSHLESLEKVHIISENKQHKANVDNILRYSNCTPFSNKTLSGIVCAYCKETYADLPDLRMHTLEKHKDDELHDNKRMDKNNLSIKVDITDLTCNICNAKLDNISILKKHLTNEHSITFYSDVNDYILEFKLSESEMLNCALCNSTYETFKMLLQHMNGHYRNYICEVCDMGFINKHRLRNHQRTHELGTFKCAFCEKVFSTRVRKACHEKYTHNTNARYTTNCPQCNESFTSYYQRNRHMFKEHNTSAATYKCNICDKSFILKSKLTSHIKKVHLMERNHICAECGQGFFIKQSLDEHMVKHNGERVFKCTVCLKAYARKKTLREHMRIHNNDRRFKCGVCGYAFVQKCSLKSHMLSNHGITLSEYETARNSMSSINKIE